MMAPKIKEARQTDRTVHLGRWGRTVGSGREPASIEGVARIRNRLRGFIESVIAAEAFRSPSNDPFTMEFSLRGIRRSRRAPLTFNGGDAELVLPAVFVALP